MGMEPGSLVIPLSLLGVGKSVRLDKRSWTLLAHDTSPLVHLVFYLGLLSGL